MGEKVLRIPFYYLQVPGTKEAPGTKALAPQVLIAIKVTKQTLGQLCTLFLSAVELLENELQLWSLHELL